MESQEQQPNPEFLKGFNNGYLLARHAPALTDKLSMQPNDHNEYFTGFMFGKEQWEQEVRDFSKSFSRGGQGKDRDSQDFERGR